MSYKRFEFLDFTRGIAIVLMLMYHFAFGLVQLGLFNVNFSADIFWVAFRIIIVFLFLSLVGIGLFLSTMNGLNYKRYFKRLMLLLSYLLLISWLSYIVRPEYYVFFGILHLIFVSSIFAMFFVRFYWLNIFLVAIMMTLPFLLKNYNVIFNQPYLLWLGLNDSLFTTDDYAPILPWFSFVLMGIFIARYFFEKNTLEEGQINKIKQWKAKHWLTKIICWGGRYSIHIYFIHFQTFYLLIYLFA